MPSLKNILMDFSFRQTLRYSIKARQMKIIMRRQWNPFTRIISVRGKENVTSRSVSSLRRCCSGFLFDYAPDMVDVGCCLKRRVVASIPLKSSKALSGIVSSYDFFSLHRLQITVMDRCFKFWSGWILFQNH